MASFFFAVGFLLPFAGWSQSSRRELQRLIMKEEGVYTGPIDGKFGPGTKRAIEALARK